MKEIAELFQFSISIQSSHVSHQIVIGFFSIKGDQLNLFELLQQQIQGMMIATHQFLTDRPKIEYYGWQLDFPPGVSKINMYDRSHNITSHQNTSPHVSISAKRQYYRIFCAPILLLTMLRGFLQIQVWQLTRTRQSI